MPRKSAAALSVIGVDGQPTRLRPPASLSQAERTIFVDTITACEVQHFRPSDLPLLCRYCETVATLDQAAAQLRLGLVVDGKPSPWLGVQKRAIKSLVTLARQLRLSPLARAPNNPTRPAKGDRAALQLAIASIQDDPARAEQVAAKLREDGWPLRQLRQSMSHAAPDAVAGAAVLRGRGR